MAKYDVSTSIPRNVQIVYNIYIEGDSSFQVAGALHKPNERAGNSYTHRYTTFRYRYRAISQAIDFNGQHDNPILNRC